MLERNKSLLKLWPRGEHPMQLERAALEASMLAWSIEVPIEVARLCGDYVHPRSMAVVVEQQ